MRLNLTLRRGVVALVQVFLATRKSADSVKGVIAIVATYLYVAL